MRSGGLDFRSYVSSFLTFWLTSSTTFLLALPFFLSALHSLAAPPYSAILSSFLPHFLLGGFPVSSSLLLPSSEIPPMVQVLCMPPPPPPTSASVFPPPLSSSLPFSGSSFLPELPSFAPSAVAFRLFVVVYLSIYLFA